MPRWQVPARMLQVTDTDANPTSSTNLTTAQLWDQLGQTLGQYFARRLADPHTAADLTQETFLRIHRGLSTLTDADRIGPWVFRIARNVLIDHLRRAKPPSQQDTSQLPAEDSPEEAPEQGLEDRLGRCLRSMLAELPDNYRNAVEAVEIDGRTQVDYAAAAGLSVSGAKSRVQRGRQQLKQSLLACCRFEFDQRGKPLAFKPNTGCENHCGCE